MLIQQSLSVGCNYSFWVHLSVIGLISLSTSQFVFFSFADQHHTSNQPGTETSLQSLLPPTFNWSGHLCQAVSTTNRKAYPQSHPLQFQPAYRASTPCSASQSRGHICRRAAVELPWQQAMVFHLVFFFFSLCSSLFHVPFSPSLSCPVTCIFKGSVVILLAKQVLRLPGVQERRAISQADKVKQTSSATQTCFVKVRTGCLTTLNGTDIHSEQCIRHWNIILDEWNGVFCLSKPKKQQDRCANKWSSGINLQSLPNQW